MEPAVIQLTSDDINFQIKSKLLLRDVIIRGGFSLKPGCDLESCTYCPAIHLNLETNKMNDDRNQEISDYADLSLCDVYQNSALFRLSPNSVLNLTNVNFVNIRHQPKALILNQCGHLNMSNVIFSNVMADRLGLNGGVIQQIPMTEYEPYYCGSFYYNTGLVELLNNGYEYSDDSYFSGFLWLTALQSITITNVTFQYNYILIGKTQQIYGSALMFLMRFRELRVGNCTFLYNFADTGSALYIYSSLSIPIIPKDGISSEHTLLHVLIENNVFANNTGRLGSVLYIRYLQDHQNIALRNNTFVNNFATQDGIADFNFGYLSADFTTGVYQAVLIDGQLLNVFIPPVTTTFSNLRFVSNYSPRVSFISNVANVVMTDCYYFDDGDSSAGLTFLTMPLKGYFENPFTYMQVLYTNVSKLLCKETINISNFYSVSVFATTFEALLCKYGSPGLYVSGQMTLVTSSQISISKVTLKDNIGFGMLAFVASIDLSLENLTFLNNSNTANEYSVCLDITQAEPSLIEIRNSVFVGNSGVFATIARVSGAKGFTLVGVTLLDNTASSTSSGIVFTPLSQMDSYITVTDSVFRNNSAMRSGCILVSETTGNMVINSSHVNVLMRNNTFRENKSKYGGAAMSISGFVVLSDASFISNNTFLNNTCTEGGAALYISFVSGQLTVESSYFKSNSGPLGSAIFSTHQGSQNGKTFLALKDDIFQRNTGKSTVHLAGVDFPLIVTRGNSFSANSGSCFVINSGKWTDEGSSYVTNTANEGGVLISMDIAEVIITSGQFTSNSASLKGGVISSTTHSAVLCISCQFTNNSCSQIGGVVSLDQESVFNCTNCQFSRNRALSKGSVIYSIFGFASIVNCTLSDNFAGDFGAVVLLESSFHFQGSVLTRNAATQRSPGIVLSMSNLTITQSVFANQTASAGAFIFGSIFNTILMEDSKFVNGRADSGAVLYVTVNSSITANRSYFEDCEATTYGSLAEARGVVIKFNEITVSGLVSPLSNGALYVIQADVTITSSTMFNLQGSAVISQASTIRVDSTQFDSIVAMQGSVVNCMDCMSLLISNSVLSNGLARQGGAVYSYTSGVLLYSLVSLFANNTFSNNKAVNGGAIYSNSVQMQIRGNTFVNNSANESNFDATGMLRKGVGGAVFAVCEFVLLCNFRFQENTFAANSAENRGGAIYWFDSYPEISSNVMTQNQANYGADIASFPIKLVPVASILEQLDYLTNDTIPLVQIYNHVASGSVSPETTLLALVDHYGNIVDDSVSSAKVVLSEGNITISGNTEVIASDGVFTFNELKFVATPESEHKITLTSNAIDPSLKIYTNDPNTYINSVSIVVKFRACVMGESLQNLECYRCPSGTFSLDPSQPCNSCPSHVICYGNYTMAPDLGYWRPDAALNLFFACPNPSACIGSPNSLSTISLKGTCAVGYEDNLCTKCQIGYSRQGKYQCGKCPSLTSNVIVTTLIVISALTLGGIIIIVAVRGANKPRSELNIHLKIFMNYLQMVVVAASLNLNWPDFVNVFLNGQDTAGSMTEQLFSFDCIMQKVASDQVFYKKLQSNALMPAGLLMLAMCVWLLISLCSTIAQLIHKLIASLVMIIFVLHPSLTKMMFSMFACMEIMPEELWLVADLSLRCWSSNHVRNILLVSVPSIAVWIFGLPMICFVILYRFRKRLSDPLTQLKFSFLYKGYHSSWYFWEFVILYRKVALVCASVFLSTVSIMVQALSVLAVLLVSLFFQLQIQPFVTPIFNRLELKSILVSSVTIYSGLFYETDSLRNLQAAIEGKVILFIAILCTNSYFLLSWLRCVLPLVIETIRRKLLVISKQYQVHPIVRKNPKTDSVLSSVSGASKMTHEIQPDQSEVRLT